MAPEDLIVNQEFKKINFYRKGQKSPNCLNYPKVKIDQHLQKGQQRPFKAAKDYPSYSVVEPDQGL